MGQPDEPLSELAQTAAAAHELFITLVGSGFNEIQALYIVSQILSNSRNSGGP